MIAQSQIRGHPKYDSIPMRSSTHQWNLSRIFGSQFVGCASSPSWPEAGIATRIIPAQSSRWTYRVQGDVHCQLTDLVVDDHRGDDLHILVRPQIKLFRYIQFLGQGFR